MSQIIDRINEGGPVFMVPILIVLFICIILLILALVGKKGITNTTKLVAHLSLFAMVWGFAGSTIGLIQAFDAIEGAGGVSQPMMAGGLKVALLCTLFGLFTFAVVRLGIVGLVLKEQLKADKAA